LLSLLAATTTYKHYSNGCQLATEDEVQFTTSVTHNGETYNNVEITVDEYRGYKCRQSTSTQSGEDERCYSAHSKAQSFASTESGETEPESISDYMCSPSAVTDVSRTVQLTLGGSTVDKVVEWSNITACGCHLPT
jgi:hypothetical protein